MFRFSILTAVSSDQQAAEDKHSLEDQERTARHFGLSQGGQEIATYKLDGYSRTGYESLSEAAEKIPPLKKALDEIDLYDVLIMDNFDRLGDIAPMLRTRFKKNRKQLVSARQSGHIVPARAYDPYADDRTDIDLHVQGILQSYRINKIRRGWNIGIPARVERGLHPLSLPYGYELGQPGQPARLVPAEAELLKQMKDWMLSGASYAEICRRADQLHPPRRGGQWTINVVRRMLINPYYAGIVRYGRLRTINGKRVPQPRSEWRTGQGQHTPLWDETTHRALLAEFERRVERRMHYNVTYPFTGLTYCGVCGEKVNKHGSGYKYLSCSARNRHWSMRYDQAREYLTDALVRRLKTYQASPPAPADTAALQAQLREYNTLLDRIQAGYEAGLYNITDALKKKSDLDEKIQRAQQQLTEIEENTSTRAAWLEKMGGLQGMLDELPDAIRHGDPATINQLLSSMIEKIILYPNDELQIVWRG